MPRAERAVRQRITQFHQHRLESAPIPIQIVHLHYVLKMECDGTVHFGHDIFGREFFDRRENITPTEQEIIDHAGMTGGNCGVVVLFQIVGAGLCFPPDRHGGSWRDARRSHEEGRNMRNKQRFATFTPIFYGIYLSKKMGVIPI